MDSDVSTFFNGHVPEVLMIIAGLVALMLVYTYRKDSDSGSYKAVMFLGVLLGVVVMITAIARHSSWSTFDAALVLIAGFALFIRPFTKIDIVVLLALLVMGVVYLWLGGLSGNLSVLASGWPRIIVALVAGAFIYMILHFLQALVQTIGKVLNCWPVLLVLGLVCLAEGALMFAGQPSLFNLITGH